MKVKVIDEEHEKDLENSINTFIKENNICDIIYIGCKYENKKNIFKHDM